MKLHTHLIALGCLCAAITLTARAGGGPRPWQHGALQVSANHRYLEHADGTPFYYQGETAWLMPERLTRDEVAFYLGRCREAEVNVVQVQTVNGVPAMNCYAQSSHPTGYDFSSVERGAAAPGSAAGYWDHMDYIVHTAAADGIYVGMVCIWGGLVKAGLMDVEQARSYGRFLAERYRDEPNIIWIIGGDIRGDVKTEVWDTLATTLRRYDSGHLITFHPRGRTCSATWFNDRPWLDFNMFQSGHRRYGQRGGDGDYTIAENTEEDSWRYVESALAQTPLKPVLDGEPSYEGIPQGLHDLTAPRWTAADCRRYAYWSVFAGACGHTYGNNSIMQFYRPGVNAAYGATEPWYEALSNPGFNQMKYLHRLMLLFPYFDRVPDQDIIVGTKGERYERLIATRGKDYLLVYDYTGRPIRADLSRISGARKRCWWYSPTDGTFTPIGTFPSGTVEFVPSGAYGPGNDCVLVAVDERCAYVPE
jgi:hypothetical protein